MLTLSMPLTAFGTGMKPKWKAYQLSTGNLFDFADHTFKPSPTQALAPDSTSGDPYAIVEGTAEDQMRYTLSLADVRTPQATWSDGGYLIVVYDPARSPQVIYQEIKGMVAGDDGSKTPAAVTVAAIADKTGYSLAPTGLDLISVADPGAPAAHTTLAKMLVAVYRALWKKNTQTSGQWQRYADDGVTVRATATLADDGTTQSFSAFS